MNFRLFFHLYPFLFAAGSLFAAGEFSLRGRTDKEVAVYAPGEPMVFTFQVLEDGQPVAGKKLVWTRSGDDGLTESGEGVAGLEGLRVTTRLDQPGFVRIKVLAFNRDGSKVEGLVGGWGPPKTGQIFFEGGACVEPDTLRPMEEPEDFDAFWKAMVAKGESVPMKVERRELDSPNPKVKLYAVTVSCAGARPLTGYLTIPANAKPGTLGVICRFHGYGVRKHRPPTWLNEWSIVFDVNAHGLELEREDAYYDQLKKDLSGYTFDAEENADRETTYFHDMSLRVLRTLQFVKSLPEWNGKDLQFNGGSQGGLQALWGAGLDPDISSIDIWSPWCCDLGGVNKGRLKGWRPEYTPALAYYDPVYHARRIRPGTKVHLIANFGDYTCPPSGVWIVYNGIPHANKSMTVNQGTTHTFTPKPRLVFKVTPQGYGDAEWK